MSRLFSVSFSEDMLEDEMKRDRTKKRGDNIAKKYVGEDTTKLIAELSPGKKGGDFELPFGGYLSVPPGSMGKKDAVTCCMVSPSDRYKYIPPLRSDEHLLSEIYLLATSLKTLKKPLHLSVPHYPENLDLFDLAVLRRSTEEGAQWMNVDFSVSAAGRYVEIQTEKDGIYLVTSIPKQEKFSVPVNGCLYNSRLSKQISVRFPKKTTDTELECSIQITPLNRDNLPNLRLDFQKDMQDLVVASDFYEIRPSVPREFKRPITVKVPLPSMEDEDFSQEDMAVMEETQDGWRVVGSALKFTKTAVSFDTRTLSKYCVALAKPQRKFRLPEAFKHMDGENDVTRGEILPFIHIQEKLWTLWFDCVPNEKSQACIHKRQKQGFRHIKQSQISINIEAPDDEGEEPVLIRRSWRSRPKSKPVEEEKPDRTDLDLLPGKVFQLDIGGDLRLCEDDKGSSYMGIQFNDRIPENYRRFFIEPAPLEEGKEVTGILKIFTDIDEKGRKKQKCVRAFDFDIDREAVAAYYYVEPEPEPEPEPEAESEPEVELTPVTLAPPTSPKQTKRPQTASFLRLTKPSKPPRVVVKESKVLTGRSLMCLAREVEQGLTLAIYLDISDSTITGMGFDALANGLSLVDITYRILLLWKRRSSKFKDKQVDMLTEALQEMGREDMAAVVMDRHRQNLEITQDCFDMAIAAE